MAGLESKNTVWYLKIDEVREMVRSERNLRSATLLEVEAQTGVSQFTISNFLNGKGLSTNSAISLIKWANRRFDTYIGRRRESPRHVETAQERELRILMNFMANNGLSVEPDESVVSAAIRFLATKRDELNG